MRSALLLGAVLALSGLVGCGGRIEDDEGEPPSAEEPSAERASLRCAPDVEDGARCDPGTPSCLRVVAPYRTVAYTCVDGRWQNQP